MASRDLAKTLSAAAIRTDCIAIENQGHATDVPALEPGPAHAGFHPLDDQIAFELGDRGDDYHDSPAERPAGVDVFPEADELDVETVEFIEQFEVVLHRPGDSI